MPVQQDLKENEVLSGLKGLQDLKDQKGFKVFQVKQVQLDQEVLKENEAYKGLLVKMLML